jgi:hypothetical protein
MKLTHLSLLLASSMLTAPMVCASDRYDDNSHYENHEHHTEERQAQKSTPSTRAWIDHFYQQHPNGELLELEREHNRLEVKYRDNGMIYKRTYRIQQ